jgi:hypothetical protein
VYRVQLAATLVAILIAQRSIDPIADPPPILTPDDIRAAQEKFDREMKQDTKRPWDNMDLTGPHALQKRPPQTEGRSPASEKSPD